MMDEQSPRSNVNRRSQTSGRDDRLSRAIADVLTALEVGTPIDRSATPLTKSIAERRFSIPFEVSIKMQQEARPSGP